MHYADTNFLVAAYFRDPGRTPAVERYLRRLSVPVVVSDLTRFEARGVFARLEGSADGPGWQALVSRLKVGSAWRGQSVAWEKALSRGADLIRRFAPRLVAGSLDTLHVAIALDFGCARFLSFDTHSHARVLAASARLEVWPPLAPQEKAQVLR